METLKEAMEARGLDEIALAKITHDKHRRHIWDLIEQKIGRGLNEKSYRRMDPVRIQCLRDGLAEPTLWERQILCRAFGIRSVQELIFETLDKESGKLSVVPLPNRPNLNYVL